MALTDLELMDFFQQCDKSGKSSNLFIAASLEIIRFTAISAENKQKKKTFKNIFGSAFSPFSACFCELSDDAAS